MKENPQKSKHLKLDDRVQIQECLGKKMTFKAIGKLIGKDQTTVSKEVKKHLYTHRNGFYKEGKGVCPLLLKAPFVRNGCENRSKSCCQFERQLYDARRAQNEYEALLSDAREGTPFSKEAFYETDRIVSFAVEQGQHIYHISQTYKLSMSLASVYRHIKNRNFSISALDLPRAVKFKTRVKKTEEKIPKGLKINRTYQDFCSFMDLSNFNGYVELDTVIGEIGGKTIMTIHFTAFNFMLGFLLNKKTSAQVTEKILTLKALLTSNGYSFGELIPVILTDNGGEFSNVVAIENNASGELETNLFFCDPSSPEQKARIEKNHTMLRDILRKGTSFDAFTQKDINTIFSHINSVKRKEFNGKSAYELFAFAFSDELANLLGIVKIPAEQVIQSSKLLKLL